MRRETSVLTVCGAHAKAAFVFALLLASVLSSLSVSADERVVFGSFRSEENAENWARRLSQIFGENVVSAANELEGVVWHRVQTPVISQTEADLLARKAEASGVSYWRVTASAEVAVVLETPEKDEALPSPTTSPTPSLVEEQIRLEPPPGISQTESLPRTNSRDSHSVVQRTETDFGIEARAFSDEGFAGQDRYTGSVSLEVEHFRSWDQDRQSLTVTPFIRFDSEDSDRSHFDMRELYWTQVGESWDLHVGARRVFWGVTEFHHLVDIINQTDLVENIDGEDKLGQPMVQLSLVRDWGIVDVFALLGHRERTFPGDDGRLRGPFEVTDNAQYESGAEELRTDFAIRWSNHLGPFELGVHHFSGTSRDPMFALEPNGREVLPYYPVIDQTGVDALAITGDWAFKVEGMTRSGFGDRYSAFNVGLERTFVGLFGSVTDLGIVLEYMHDDREEDAFNTFFENDIALGGRFAFNDFADTQALFGIISDTENSDVIYSVEASRQLGPTWLVTVEGRVFQGGRSAERAIQSGRFFDPDFKSAWLQDDDYLQIEFKKFF